jgi:hypothetical protein
MTNEIEIPWLDLSLKEKVNRLLLDVWVLHLLLIPDWKLR